MDNADVYTLVATEITAPLTAQAYTPITNLQGMRSAGIVAFFQYGSGGVSLTAKAQTSFDGGTTWDDIAEFNFTTVTDKKRAGVGMGSSYDPASIPGLSSETIVDSLLGDRLRAVITSVGTYVNTTLSLRASVG